MSIVVKSKECRARSCLESTVQTYDFEKRFWRHMLIQKTCCDEPEGHACAFHLRKTVVTEEHNMNSEIRREAHLLLELKYTRTYR